MLNYSISNSFRGKIELDKCGYNGSNIAVIHNAYLGNYKSKPEDVNNNEVTVLTIGRFVEQKDYLTALQAFKIVTQNCLQEHIKNKIPYHWLWSNKRRNRVLFKPKQSNKC